MLTPKKKDDISDILKECGLEPELATIEEIDEEAIAFDLIHSKGYSESKEDLMKDVIEFVTK